MSLKLKFKIWWDLQQLDPTIFHAGIRQLSR